jgi:hypothetical protein
MRKCLKYLVYMLYRVHADLGVNVGGNVLDGLMLSLAKLLRREAYMYANLLTCIVTCDLKLHNI